MGSIWSVPRVACFIALGAVSLSACDCGQSDLQGVHRDMATVSVGDTEVTLSFECAGRHTGVTLAGSGRVPTGLHSPTDDWWVDFGISAERHGARLHLADAIGSTRLVVEDDAVGAEVVARLEAQSCIHADRAAFRFVDPEGVFSMPWAVAYVVGELLLLTEGEAGDSCEEVAAAAPDVQGVLTARNEAGANYICDHLVYAGRYLDGVLCANAERQYRLFEDDSLATLRARAAEEGEFQEHVVTQLGPDVNGWRLYEKLFDDLPAEAQSRVITPWLEWCEDPTTGCRRPRHLADLAARVDDPATCDRMHRVAGAIATAALEAEAEAEAEADSEYQVRPYSAAAVILELTRTSLDCGAPELLRDALLPGLQISETAAEGGPDLGMVSRCSPRVAEDRVQFCGSLPRLAGHYFARHCDGEATAGARAVASGATDPGDFEDPAIDAALHILSRCDAETFEGLVMATVAPGAAGTVGDRYGPANSGSGTRP